MHAKVILYPGAAVVTRRRTVAVPPDGKLEWAGLSPHIVPTSLRSSHCRWWRRLPEPPNPILSRLA